MANAKSRSTRPGELSTVTLTETESNMVLHNNLDPLLWYGIGTCKISVTGTGWTGGVTVKKRTRGSGQAAVACVYQNANTDTTVAAGTPISADGNYYVRCDADEIVLDYAHTSGSAVLEYAHRVG